MRPKYLFIAIICVFMSQLSCNFLSQVPSKVATSKPNPLPTNTSVPNNSLPTQTLQPPTETLQPEITQPTPRQNGANWFEDDCSAIGTGRALFGLEYMNLATSDGRCHITANSNSVELPVMYTFPILDNAAVEIEISVDAINPASGYGIIFRSDEVISDGLAYYYLLSISPGEKIITLSLWNNDQWTLISQQELLEDLIVPGKPTLVRLEIVDNQFRIFLDGNFALEGLDDQIASSGIFGISINTSSAPETLHYDNFKIFSLAP